MVSHCSNALYVVTLTVALLSPVSSSVISRLSDHLVAAAPIIGARHCLTTCAEHVLDARAASALGKDSDPVACFEFLYIWILIWKLSPLYRVISFTGPSQSPPLRLPLPLGALLACPVRSRPTPWQVGCAPHSVSPFPATTTRADALSPPPPGGHSLGSSPLLRHRLKKTSSAGNAAALGFHSQERDTVNVARWGFKKRLWLQRWQPVPRVWIFLN